MKSSQQERFTPRVMLSAPRRSAAEPNISGTRLLYTTSTYSFTSQTKVSQTCIFDLEQKRSTIFLQDAACFNAKWLNGPDDIIYLRSEDNGCTAIVIADEDGQILSSTRVEGPVSNLKVTSLGESSYMVAMVGKATPAGELHNPNTAAKPRSSAMIYTKQSVQYWDEFITGNVNQIFYGILDRSVSGRYSMRGKVTNALAGSGMTAPLPWYGGNGSDADFDISSHGLLFATRDPKLNPSKDTRVDIYYVPWRQDNETSTMTPKPIRVPGLRGVAFCPVFSSDGKRAVFLQTEYEETDKCHIVHVHDIGGKNFTQTLFPLAGDKTWKLSPTNIQCWSQGCQTLLCTAEEHGIGKLWAVALNDSNDMPSCIFQEGSVDAAFFLPGVDQEILISSSTFVDNSIWSKVNLKTLSHTRVSSNLSSLSKYGISQHNQVTDFWFEGADSHQVHAWVIRPSCFSETASRKYPLAFVIHGGPAQAWMDAWSTRWNLLCLAEAGFVVVAINFHGSTGYGQAFCDSVQGEWGGLPFRDLELGFDYVQSNLAYVDTTQAVALGGSYGGYMVAWIAGQAFAKKFKAFICHDGRVTTQNSLAADDFTGKVAAFRGTYWENMQVYDKYDPARFTANWSTPMLIIHGKNDYRVPFVEGLGMFGVLQYKEIPSKFIAFPDENHWVLKPENSLVWHEEVYEWIKIYTEDDPDSIEWLKDYSGS